MYNNFNQDLLRLVAQQNIHFFVALQQLQPRLNEAYCHTAKNVACFDVSPVKVEKLKTSPLYVLYDLNCLISPSEENRVLSIALLECDGYGFLSTS